MHNHQYIEAEKVSDDIMHDEGVDIYEEEISDTLTKGLLPIVVELGHIVSQMKSECV